AGTRAPVPISSMPKGAPMTPGLYSIIEDVVAVNGGGGRPYREALRKRYEASSLFRRMLVRLSFFWGLGALSMAIATTIIVFVVRREIAFGIGWAVPFVWAGIWARINTVWVQRQLRIENNAWRREYC